ncbi:MULTISPECIES: AVAST type 1 anti-phage system protein Avs1c [Cyclobacteriaceae]|uniref:AVAST type 1 anti-phage system protein Avs1c n=2 Tax=Cyclobacteriaceae TaxID=563798 RepID=A0ABV9T0G9_9BACT
MFEPRGYYIKSRKEFERNLNTTAELARNGRLVFSEQSRKGIESLMKVRVLPNARINLSTINELVRATTMMTGMKNFNNVKNEET